MMDDSSFTAKIKINSSPVAVKLGYAALLDTDSPHIFYQCPRAGEHETRGRCIRHLRTPHSTEVLRGGW